MCFTAGMFPDILKHAEICPIFKKGDAMNVRNYRPVSILPIVSKIYEKEMVRQLENYFEDPTHVLVAQMAECHRELYPGRNVFLLYINDLETNVPLFKYVDDSTLFEIYIIKERLET